MAAPKGSRPPNAGKGRVKGVPNKSTGRAKEAISRFCEGNAQQLQAWLKEIQRDDGARAAMDTYLKVLEYHLPKLNRTEHAGGVDLNVTVKAEPLDDQL